MTIIEKILLEVSAKVDDGKPNFKNKEHIVILSEVLTNLGWTIEQKSELIGNLTGIKLNEATIASVRDIIIDKLGSKLGLAGPPTQKNITSTKGESSEKIAKEVGSILKTNVKVLPPGTLPNKSSRFDAISFEYEGKSFMYKISVGSGGKGGVPGDAAYYEMGICVEYNKLKGMDEETAFKSADVDLKKYEPFREHLTEVCGKIAKNLPNVGSSLRQTGGDKYSPARSWPTNEGTPKTDIYGGANHRISVKKEGGSQLVSGGGGDAKGVFEGALTFYQEHDKAKSVEQIQSLITTIENDFKKFNTDNSVGKVRKDTGNAYLGWRKPQIEKEVKKLKLKLKPVEIEKHAKAELMAAGIIGEAGKWSQWAIEGIKVLSISDVMKWFNSYVKSQGSEELQNEVRDIVMAAIDHKRISVEFDKIFQDSNFKKWVVYEAASGNYKFSGDSSLSSPSNGIANEILVFGMSGNVDVKTIDVNWAKSYASHVTSNVGYKSSGRSKFTSFRLLSEINESEKLTLFESDVNNIIQEELKNLNSELDTFILQEGFFDKFKKLGKRLVKKIKDSVKNFYDKVLKKIINKLKEYAKKGIDKFAEILGIDIDGSSQVRISF